MAGYWDPDSFQFFNPIASLKLPCQRCWMVGHLLFKLMLNWNPKTWLYNLRSRWSGPLVLNYLFFLENHLWAGNCPLPSFLWRLQNCSFTVTFTYFVHTSHSLLQILKCRKPYTLPVVTRFQIIFSKLCWQKTIDGFKEHEILVKYALVYCIDLRCRRRHLTFRHKTTTTLFLVKWAYLVLGPPKAAG